MESAITPGNANAIAQKPTPRSSDDRSNPAIDLTIAIKPTFGVSWGVSAYMLPSMAELRR